MKSLKELVTEKSISQKHKELKMTQKFIMGELKNVKTAVIMSPQNPLGIKDINRNNRVAKKDLEKYLKNGHYAFHKLLGKYGQYEESYIIFNISLEDAKEINLKYVQDTFIFVENTNPMKWSVYKFRPEPEPHYEFNGSYEGNVSDERSADDFFSKLGKRFKFSIPFGDEVWESIEMSALKTNEILEFKLQKDPDALDESMEDSRTGRSKYMRRIMLYGSMFQD